MDNQILTEEKIVLIAGTFPIITQEVTIKTGENLKKDTLVSIDSVSKKAVISSDTQKDYFGILTADVDATGGDKIATVMVTGEFFGDAIKATDGHIIDRIIARNKSIFIK